MPLKIFDLSDNGHGFKGIILGTTIPFKRFESSFNALSVNT
jgi:hypothetical protein